MPIPLEIAACAEVIGIQESMCNDCLTAEVLSENIWKVVASEQKDNHVHTTVWRVETPTCRAEGLSWEGEGSTTQSHYVQGQGQAEPDATAKNTLQQLAGVKEGQIPAWLDRPFPIAPTEDLNGDHLHISRPQNIAWVRSPAPPLEAIWVRKPQSDAGCPCFTRYDQSLFKPSDQAVIGAYTLDLLKMTAQIPEWVVRASNGSRHAYLLHGNQEAHLQLGSERVWMLQGGGDGVVAQLTAFVLGEHLSLQTMAFSADTKNVYMMPTGIQIVRFNETNVTGKTADLPPWAVSSAGAPPGTLVGSTEMQFLPWWRLKEILEAEVPPK